MFADRQALDEQRQQLSLDRLEPAFGRHDEAFSAGPFGMAKRDIVRLLFAAPMDAKETKARFVKCRARRPGLLRFPRGERP